MRFVNLCPEWQRVNHRAGVEQNIGLDLGKATTLRPEAVRFGQENGNVMVRIRPRIAVSP